MKVLYGVVGEGMGHAIWSRVVLDYLPSMGHEVELMASSCSCDFLKKRYRGEGVNRVSGIHLVYKDNRVRRGKTAWANIPSGVVKNPLTSLPLHTLRARALVRKVLCISFPPQQLIASV